MILRKVIEGLASASAAATATDGAGAADWREGAAARAMASDGFAAGVAGGAGFAAGVAGGAGFAAGAAGCAMTKLENSATLINTGTIFLLYITCFLISRCLDCKPRCHFISLTYIT